jgi:hypothetical protein
MKRVRTLLLAATLGALLLLTVGAGRASADPGLWDGSGDAANFHVLPEDPGLNVLPEDPGVNLLPEDPGLNLLPEDPGVDSLPQDPGLE